jgi:hypothetical protein
LESVFLLVFLLQGGNPFHDALLGGGLEGIIPVSGWDSGARLGSDLAPLGDVNGDGVPDFLASGLGTTGVRYGEAVLISGADGSLIHRWGAPPLAPTFGDSVAALGDLDGDGLPEVAVAAHRAGFGGIDSGRVWIYSSTDWDTALKVIDGKPGDKLGHSMARFPDLDGDGVDDFLVSAHGNSVAALAAGKATVYSGATFTPLVKAFGSNPGDSLGKSVESITDQDGDGLPDLLLGVYFYGADARGAVEVHSGADGSLLYRVEGRSQERLGRSVCPLGDLDGDGWADFAAGANHADPYGADSGRVVVLAGGPRQGALLWEARGETAGMHYGRALAALPDLDGDGLAELGVGGYFDASAGATVPGVVDLLSGADGHRVQRLTGAAADDGFGSALASAAAFDAGGLRLLIGAERHDNAAGAAWKLTLRPYLQSGASRVSVSGSGVHATLPLHFDFPPSEAFQGYLLLFSGGEPGPWNAFGTGAPIQPDAIAQAVLHAATQSPNLGIHGLLDPAGDAQALFDPASFGGALLPLAGRRLCMAAVSFSTGSQQPRLSSTALLVEMLP